MVGSKERSYDNDKRQINDSATDVSADILSFAPRESFYSEVEEKKSINVFLLMIPSFFDMMETSLKNITLVLIATSVTQMLRCTILIITYVLAILFLKRKVYRHHVSAIVLMMAGIILGGLSQYDPNDARGLPLIAVIVVLVA